MVHEVAKSWTRLSDFTFTFHFHALEKEMAPHSSVLAWRISGMGEPGGLPSMGSHRVRHDWSYLAAAAYLNIELFPKVVCKRESHTHQPKWNLKKHTHVILEWLDLFLRKAWGSVTNLLHWKFPLGLEMFYFIYGLAWVFWGNSDYFLLRTFERALPSLLICVLHDQN